MSRSAVRSTPPAELARGPKRNFQILSPLDFLAEFTQHIPPTGAHLIRYYGWYSNKARGQRRKRQPAAEAAALGLALRSPLGAGLPAPPLSGPQVSAEPPGRASQSWAMLIKRVYEVDPLACPKCGAAMKVVAFIEPPQADVIERILRHCGLWNPPPPRAPPAEDASVHDRDEPRELTYVDIDTFEATF